MIKTVLAILTLSTLLFALSDFDELENDACLSDPKCEEKEYRKFENSLQKDYDIDKVTPQAGFDELDEGIKSFDQESQK